ncbi:P-loop containing nucleoside triphosphate hydrolase protein [Sistotremastrum niveocremeum HHB9708]|uniref:p-loop containing nucleoside triphosphate hydrolase protein n=1 Tax=Sistotremastrum niveocremeum HHB9708 TaxID=1314777 RepID=A0A164UHV2_9AGAM|nr:P-loop containing nucleoside triphosphate hydrolase protein [Sistotremastrum niveocremeum HHB9708]
MPPPQVVFVDTGNVISTFAKTKGSIWLHPLLIPVYVALFSIFIFALHGIARIPAVSRLLVRWKLREEPTETESDPPTHTGGLYTDIKEHIRKEGGLYIFSLKALRLAGCLTLVGLTIAVIISEKHDHAKTSEKHWGKKKKKGKKRNQDVWFTDDEWVQIGLCFVFAYTAFLSLLSLTAKRRWAVRAARHLVLILLVIFAVYFYRDFWAFATYTGSPADQVEGVYLWPKFGVLSLVSVLVPLIMPSQYIPLDPKNPQETPNKEQTASPISFMTFSFLDEIVFKAYRMPHLSWNLLPPLCDYDKSEYLAQRSFKYLYPANGAKRRHLFFSLMRVFWKEYIQLFIWITIKVLSQFAPPLAINRLLDSMEKKGDGVLVRPWIWILLLFLGPVVGSISMQWYIFVATGSLVRVESMFTQLVFEHALRIRLVEKSSRSGSAASTRTSSPDTASIADSTVAESSAAGSLADSEATVADPKAAASNESPIKGSTTQPAAIPSPTPAVTPDDTDSGPKASNLIGKINNLITVDTQNIVDGRDFLLVAWYCPLQIALCIWFLYLLLGWSAFIGMLVMILCFPLPGYVAKLVNTVQVERMKRTDARTQGVTEVMNVLRMIKLFGWEPKMLARLTETRDEELKWIKKRQILQLVNAVLNYTIPLLSLISTYSIYTLVMKQELTASRVFSSMALFDMMRDQLHMVFFMIPAVIQAKVSLERVSEFLEESELLDAFNPAYEDRKAIAGQVPSQEVIGFHDATFSWSDTSSGITTPSRRDFRLRIDGDLEFKRGQINLIVGPTGSGKTSLLYALLGEMHLQSSGPGSWFNLPREGGVAYAAQESWVQNETIKDNILFGSPYDEERYRKVIYQCALERDLALLHAGDQTEVGEKGLTMSGGQKARITLARAIYSPAQILLLDDVLAALDVHTSQWIVDKCFRGDLVAGRTVLLVTHNVAIASPVASFVVSLGLDGRVVSQGSMADALSHNKTLLADVAQEQQAIENAKENSDAPIVEAKEVKPDGKLIVAEEIAEGHISWQALKLYLSSLGGFKFWMAYVLGTLICDILSTVQTWFLGYWASQYEHRPASEVNVPGYLAVYAALLGIAVAFYSAAWTVYIFGAIKASRNIYRKLIEAILGTTLRWLDTVPTSRVIARCTQDIRAVDGPVSQHLVDLIEMSITLVCKLAAVVIMTPPFILPGVLVGLVGGWLGQVYIKAQLSVKREMSNARSPVLGHFGAAIVGLTSLRAYGAQGSFKLESMKRIDKYTRAARTFYNLNRWICLRADSLGAVFSAGLAAYLVYCTDSDASSTGFSLNMAVGFSGLILWWVRIANEFEVQGNSLERIQDYIDIDQEPKATPEGKPPAYWPSSGEIRVENLSARYSSDGPEVLHNLSFNIKSGERIGVVGRTGSGKSSLTLSLLRCIYTSGSVFYDGLDTSKMNLDALRSNITIIPQQPELITGTLRQNLDPFSDHDDAVLNDALHAAGLTNLQDESDEGRITLETTIASGGSNLSVGQRQILALARAIVRGSKLLILDEATSAIDYETDNIVQTSIRRELKDVTLLTVAHRLQTIMDADKIMVLDSGNLVEFDSPSNLLKNPNGYLRSLVDKSGDKAKLYAMAGL